MLSFYIPTGVVMVMVMVQEEEVVEVLVVVNRLAFMCVTKGENHVCVCMCLCCGRERVPCCVEIAGSYDSLLPWTHTHTGIWIAGWWW